MAEYLGELEQVVMLAVARLGSGAYGVAVRNEIEERGGRTMSLGSVYSTLYRLEEKGYLRSSRGEPTAERGGRAKRVFEMEAPGVAALQRTRRMLERMWEGAEPALRLSPSCGSGSGWTGGRRRCWSGWAPGARRSCSWGIWRRSGGAVGPRGLRGGGWRGGGRGT